MQGTTLWRARTTLERILFIIVSGLLLLVIVLSIVISSKNSWVEPRILHIAPPEGKHNIYLNI